MKHPEHICRYNDGESSCQCYDEGFIAGYSAGSDNDIKTMFSIIYIFIVGGVIYILLLISAIIFTFKVNAQIKTTATVPVNYQCEVKGFDLYCRTNAERVFINNKLSE